MKTESHKAHLIVNGIEICPAPCYINAIYYMFITTVNKEIGKVEVTVLYM